MIRQVEPRNVMLVHGEKEKMAFLKQKIIDQFHIPVYDPPNWTSVTMHGNDDIPVTISSSLLKRAFEESALDAKKQKVRGPDSSKPNTPGTYHTRKRQWCAVDEYWPVRSPSVTARGGRRGARVSVA